MSFLYGFSATEEILYCSVLIVGVARVRWAFPSLPFFQVTFDFFIWFCLFPNLPVYQKLVGFQYDFILLLVALFPYMLEVSFFLLLLPWINPLIFQDFYILFSFWRNRYSVHWIKIKCNKNWSWSIFNLWVGDLPNSLKIVKFTAIWVYIQIIIN